VTKAKLRVAIAASVLFADVSQALADECSNMRAQIAQIQSDATLATTEQNRVAAITPLPQTDAALCAAESKLIRDAQAMLGEPVSDCYDAQNTATVNDAINQMYHGANEVAGQMHCPR
jgi:hypothetical protein